MRFTSNGYPADQVTVVYEYNSTFGPNRPDHVHAGIDQVSPRLWPPREPTRSI